MTKCDVYKKLWKTTLYVLENLSEMKIFSISGAP